MQPDMAPDDMALGLEQTLARFVSGFSARMAALGRIPQELDELNVLLASHFTSVFWLGVKIILVGGITLATFILTSRAIDRRAHEPGWRNLLGVVAAVLVALLVGFAVTHFVAESALVTRTLRLWAVIAVTGCLFLHLLRAVVLYPVRPSARQRPIHLVGLARWLCFAIGWSFVGLGLVTTLRLWRAGPGLSDVVATVFVSIPALVLLVGAAWHYRRTLSGSVAGHRPRSRRRSTFARLWPAIVIGLLLFIFVNIEAAKTVGAGLPGMAVMLTVVIVIMTPHVDAMIRKWARSGLESRHISIFGAAWRQTSRVVVIIITVALLGTLWVIPLATGFGIDLSLVVSDAAKVALIALAAAFLWNLVGTAIMRIGWIEQKAGVTRQEGSPRSRLGTLVPLLAIISRSTIVCFALLSALITMGINVWPLVTGLSFFGLAVGFGSQALVKDVVSGLFFLVDDAFRLGEYVDISGSKGTVEKISIRSLSLRDGSGSVTTIPYGQMGKIQNFSRDWAVEKLSFRVAFDTDLELVRKLLGDVSGELAKDRELAPHLLEPLTSQGMTGVEKDMIVFGAKFTAKPGKQSMIRRAALKAIHDTFRQNGIRVSG